MMQAVAAAKVAEDILSEEGWYGVTVRPTMHQSTYFRPEARNTGKGIVTLGGKMIHLYTCGAPSIKLDLEMKRCGFNKPYPSYWCPAAAGVVVVCHELAHVAVHREGMRVKGSMHGRPFYRHMGRLLRKYLERMTLRFAEYAHDPGLLGEFSKRFDNVPARVKLNAALCDAYPAPSFFSGGFRKGDLVVFDFRGQRKIGQLTRRGKKRWTVRVAEEPGVKYHIPESRLRLCGKP